MTDPAAASRNRILLRGLLQAAATAVVFKLASDFAARFSESYGASFLFPPAGVSLAAGAAFGGWGVAGVLVGVLVSPWGAATTLTTLFLFALVNGIVAAIPAVALRRPSGSTATRTRRVALYGLALNNLLGAITGTALLVALGRLPAALHPVADNFVAWWISDGMAALVLGLPVLLVLRPEVLLADEDRDLFAAWLRNPRQLGTCLALAALAILLLWGMVGTGWGFPQWLAVTLLAPVALAAFQGGLGPALLVNFVVSVAHFLLLGLPAIATPRGPTHELLATAYSVLAFFSLFALVGGALAGNNRRLLEQVRRQQDQLQRDFERTVASLSAAIEAKDPTTDGHVQRVAKLTVAVGHEVGLRGRDLELLRYGALLHDIGKIGVPETVLNKASALAPEERALMQQHVEIGLRIIGNVEVLADVLPLVRFHQERWDGRREGVRFPAYFGLREEEVPLGARVLAVVDAFDAMTNDRPYRSARSESDALAELSAESGRQFDPRVVDALVTVVKESRLRDYPTGERWPLLRRA